MKNLEREDWLQLLRLMYLANSMDEYVSDLIHLACDEQLGTWIYRENLPPAIHGLFKDHPLLPMIEWPKPIDETDLIYKNVRVLASRGWFYWRSEYDNHYETSIEVVESFDIEKKIVDYLVDPVHERIMSLDWLLDKDEPVLPFLKPPHTPEPLRKLLSPDILSRVLAKYGQEMPAGG